MVVGTISRLSPKGRTVQKNIVIDGKEYKVRGKPRMVRSFFIGKLTVGDKVVCVVTEEDVRQQLLADCEPATSR